MRIARVLGQLESGSHAARTASLAAIHFGASPLLSMRLVPPQTRTCTCYPDCKVKTNVMSPGLGIAGALRAPKRQHFLIGIELQRSGTRGVCVILWIIAKACRKLAAKNIQISFIYAAFYNLFFRLYFFRDSRELLRLRRQWCRKQMQMQIQIQLQTFSRRSRGRNESGPWQNLYLTLK